MRSPNLHRPIRVLNLFAIASVLALLSGCYAIAAPPLRVELNAGYSSGSVVAREATATAAPRVTPVDFTTRLRVGVHPLQAFPELTRRRFDVGAGFVFDHYRSNETFTANYAGGYLRFSVFPWIGAASPSGAFGRFGLHMSGETGALVGGSQTVGGGITLAASIDLLGFVSGSGEGHDHHGNAGVAAGQGEGGIGLNIASSVFTTGNETVQSWTIGLSGTIPTFVSMGVCPSCIEAVGAIAVGLAQAAR